MELAASADSAEIADLSNRLREVRTACRRYVFLWAMSQSDRSINDSANPLQRPADEVEMLENFRNSHDPDWSFLFPYNECDD